MVIVSKTFSRISLELIDQAINEHPSDKGYKKLKTKEYLVFII